MPPGKTHTAPMTAATGRHLGTSGRGLRRHEVTEVRRIFESLNTDDARAGYANRVVTLMAGSLREHWAFFLTALQLVRDLELYRRPQWVGSDDEHPRAYDDFPTYFESLVKEPFDLFVELEGTQHVLLDAGYRLDALLGMRYEDARSTVAALRARPGRPPKDEKGSIRTFSPEKRGTTAEYTLARLQRDRPDLTARVAAGEMSAHAAAIEAGFRQRTITVPLGRPDAVADALRRRLSHDECLRVARRLLADGTP
jgi:hypothetical protein